MARGKRRYQVSAYLYVVYTTIKYKSGRTIDYKTYYGSQFPVSKEDIKQRALSNIAMKLLESSGELIKIRIVQE